MSAQSQRFPLRPLVLLSLLCWVSHPSSANAEPMRKGLLATLRDAGDRGPLEIMPLEPTIALAWKAGEAGHPRLKAEAGTVVWNGRIHLVRKGDYRFAVRLRGRFHLTIAGHKVLSAEVRDPAAALKSGVEVNLGAGVYSLHAEFQRLPGLARVEVLWRGPGFREEPLPYDVLGHLPDQVPPRFEADRKSEHGRFLLEEHNCLQCHRAEEEDKIAAGLAIRPSPDLSQIGQRGLSRLDRTLAGVAAQTAARCSHA